MDDAEATNLNFQLPQYKLPQILVDKIVNEFRAQRTKRGYTENDITGYFNGLKNNKFEGIIKGSISKVLMQERLSPYDESECFNPSNENAIILNILSYY